MKSLLHNLQSLTGRRVARLVVVLLAGLLLVVGISVGLRGVSAESLRRFGITEQSRVGKLIEKIRPRAKLAISMKAAPALPFTQWTVTNGNDTGSGSLRSAISSAAAGDTIIFSSGVTTVALTSGELLIDKSLTIDGGTAGVTITRSSGTFRIFNISSGTVALNKLTISGNTASSNGGGFYMAAGALNLTNCMVAGNQSSGGLGGGIYMGGAALLKNTIVATNTAGGSANIGGNSVDPASSYNFIGSGSGGLTNGTNGNRQRQHRFVCGAIAGHVHRHDFGQRFRCRFDQQSVPSGHAYHHDSRHR